MPFGRQPHRLSIQLHNNNHGVLGNLNNAHTQKGKFKSRSLTMKHLVIIPLLLTLSTASRGAFVGPASRHAQSSSRSSLSSRKDSMDTDPGNSNNHVPKSAAETTRRAALQLLSSLPLAAASTGALPANALDAVLSVPAQTKATTWPLGKVAFSLLPLAGSYSRRATGEFYTIMVCSELQVFSCILILNSLQMPNYRYSKRNNY
jgi:hypothetical protein